MTSSPSSWTEFMNSVHVDSVEELCPHAQSWWTLSMWTKFMKFVNEEGDDVTYVLFVTLSDSSFWKKYQKTKIDMNIFKCTPMPPLLFIPTCTFPKYNYNCNFDMQILNYHILILISKYYKIIWYIKSQYLDFVCLFTIYIKQLKTLMLSKAKANI